MGVPLKNPTPKPQTQNPEHTPISGTLNPKPNSATARLHGHGQEQRQGDDVFHEPQVGCISAGALKRVYGLGC